MENMKKIIVWCSMIIFASCAFKVSAEEENTHFNTAFSAGYVFKNGDERFKDVYGHGMVNIITADFCCDRCEDWGIGAKISYWSAHGFTGFLQQKSTVYEIPLTISVRRMKKFDCDLQLYASLGGGVAWIKEKNYLGATSVTKGIAELEAGLHYPIWKCINITSAFRYLFPPQKNNGIKVNVGGIDLRAGISFDF